MRSIVKKGIIGLLVLAGLLYVLAVGYLWLYQDYYMFRGRKAELTRTPAEMQWAFEEVWLDMPGGKTHAWWIPKENARGAVLYSHGNGKNIANYLEDAAYYRDLGLSVLLYDYGGYGGSTGEPSEQRCYADIRAMWKYLTETRGIPANRIILAGNSMGGAVTIDLAAEVTPGAMVVESTFTAIPDVLWDMYPFIPIRLISHIYYRSIDKVHRIKCPILQFHSADDTVVRIKRAKQLFNAMPAPKKFVELHGAHRAGKFSSKDTYAPALKEFMDHYFH